MASWGYLIVAGILEICWAMGMKYSHGFSQLWPSVFTIVTLVASFVLLNIAVKTLPIGTAYAVWTGIGILGTAILGMILLGESRSATRLFFLCLILVGIIGLKMMDAAQS
ncbi:MAG: quaternary ammonium compound efflux SMR transporter SugE [Abditibacteriaceae bacterium]